jgi:2-polyprenyl-6-methoxyphenol hydroxylase-like FAD-dependent oxidoreductase
MDAEVLVVGAGPVGLLLAGDLAAAEVRVVVLERRASPLTHARAWGLQPRTQETLALRGVLEELADGAPRMRGTMFGGLGLDYSGLDTAYPNFLHVPQTRIEAALRKRAIKLGAEIRMDEPVSAVRQDEVVATVTTTAGELTGRYVVGTDGAHSIVRAQADITMSVTSARSSAIFADVELAAPDEAPSLQGARNADGLVLILRRPPKMHRIIVLRFQPPQVEDAAITGEAVASAVEEITGRPIRFRTVAWASRFSDETGLADQYQRGKLFIAGDAAHRHSPFGGQGLNLGLQDAANLSWRMAQAVAGITSALDAYEPERRPVAAAVLENTLAQTLLLDADPETRPLREAFAELVRVPEANRHLAGQLSGTSINYGSPDGADPNAGKFLPPHFFLGSQTASMYANWRFDRDNELTDGDDTILVRPDGYISRTLVNEL